MTSERGLRPLNVTLRPESPALTAYADQAEFSPEIIATGFEPRADLDLTYRGGRTISDLVFVNRYLGGAEAWDDADRRNIDAALAAIMTDPGLEEIIAQYYRGPISSRALESDFVDGALADRFFKDDAEALVERLFREGVLDDTNPADAVICLLLPRGVVLVDGNSDGSEREAPGKAILIEDEAADSLQGLGGYHGSVHVDGTTVYYAIGVYSDDDNGIVAFDRPWKNVVATFYHELCEARTDPDVEDVNRTGDAGLLGWYSTRGGEIGDIPMALAGPDLSSVMREVTLADGAKAPVQLEWSNKVHGPEGPDPVD